MNMSPTPALEVDGVSFAYGSVQVLFDISLSVQPGEALALLGTNGAGKSTLLRVVTGLEHPSDGDVRLDGEDITGMPPESLVGKGVVLVPGGKAVFPDMSVAENLDLLVRAVDVPDRSRADRIDDVVGSFPRLGERLHQTAGRLSGGEQQQLALARALLLEPSVLCIDELSLGLAPVTVEVLLEAVRNIHARGITIVLVEQSLNVAAHLCPRAVFLEKGAVRFEGPTAELIERDDIARAVFLGGDTPTPTAAAAE